MIARRSGGYTLAELAIGLVVLGLMTVLVWRFGTMANQRVTEIQIPQTLEVVDQALMGFVAANHRLPCPDTSAARDGQEHCDGAAVGYLPVVKLGLARADVQSVRYGVYRAATADAWDDTDLAVAQDRFRPLIAIGTPAIGIEALPGSTNGIDLCQALRVANGKAATTAALHIRDASGNLMKNVAYAVALPGQLNANNDNNPFDGQNTVANAFSSPIQPVGANYDDTVRSVDFQQLFSRLSCATTLTAADHAHPNAASAAAIMYAASLDYKVQLQLKAEMEAANVVSSAAALLTAGAGASTAAAQVLIASAEALLAKGTAAGLIGIAVAAVAANASAVITATVRVGLSAGDKAAADQLVTDFQPVLDGFKTLSTSILANARAADSAGLY